MNLSFDLYFRNILPSPPQNFTGRLDELNKLRDNFDVYRVFYLSGEAGIGKTAFLSKFLSESLKERSVLYYRITNRESLISLLKKILVSEFSELFEYFKALNSHLSESEKILVIDDLYYLEKKELDVLLAFFSNYYHGSSKVFLANREKLNNRNLENPLNFFELELLALTEKESLVLMKELLGKETPDKKKCAQLFKLCKGNPFVLQQFCLAKNFSEEGLKDAQKLIVNKYTAGLSEDEKNFLFCFSLLETKFTLLQLKSAGLSETSVFNLISRKLLEGESANSFRISDLLSTSILQSHSETDKLNYLKKITLFLKETAITPEDFLTLAEKSAEAGNFREAAGLFEKHIFQWLSADLNTGRIISLFSHLLHTEGRDFLSKKILNNLFAAFLREDKFRESVALVSRLEKEPVFYPFLYWFSALSNIEINNLIDAENQITKMVSKDKELYVRAEILRGRMLLKREQISVAEKLLLSLSEEVDQLSDTKEKKSLKKFLFNNLVELYTDKEDFEKTNIYLKKIEALLKENPLKNSYNQLVSDLNLFYVKLKTRVTEEKDTQTFSMLEKEVEKYFYYNLSPVFVLLKTEFLFKWGKFSEIKNCFSEFFRKFDFEKDIYSREEAKVAVEYLQFLLLLEDFSTARDLLNRFSGKTEPLISKKIMGLGQLLKFLENGLAGWEKNEVPACDFFLNEHILSNKYPKNKIFKLLKDGNYGELLKIPEKELEKWQFSEFSIKGLFLINFSILISLKCQDYPRARDYLKSFLRILENITNLPPKWKILKILYPILIENSAEGSADLKFYLFNLDTPLYLKNLLIFVFQSAPEKIFSEILLKFDEGIFRLPQFQQNLFNLYCEAFQFNIREDFRVSYGKISRNLNILEMFRLLISQRGIVINQVEKNIFSPQGKLWISRAKMPLLYDIFEYFLINAGKNIDKEDLINNIWKKEYFPESDDFIIYNNIKRLRQELGEEGKELILVHNQSYYIPDKVKLYLLNY